MNTDNHLNAQLQQPKESEKRLPEKPMSRQQRRYQERVKEDAVNTLNRLVAKFYEVFMENDPEAPEVAAKKKEVVAKWKMYCNQKQLLPAALTLCEENCNAIIKKYQEQLTGVEEGSEKWHDQRIAAERTAAGEESEA